MISILSGIKDQKIGNFPAHGHESYDYVKNGPYVLLELNVK